MPQSLGHGLLVAGMTVLAFAASARADTRRITRDSRGIRHETITVGPVRVPETHSGRAGVGIYFYTYQYINARDAIDLTLRTARLPLAEPDVTNLIAAVRSGRTSLAALNTMILGPQGVGDSNLPAGFHGHDPAVWQAMGFGSDDWTVRCGYALQALGAGFQRGQGLETAAEVVQPYVDNGTLPAWDPAVLGGHSQGVNWSFADWLDPNSEDSYLKGFYPGPMSPHLAGVFVLGIDQAPVSVTGEGAPVRYTGPDPGLTYIASTYFLAQAQRWLETRTELESLGAQRLADQAYDFARDDAGILTDLGDPLVLDLNHDGVADVTGRSSAIVRAPQNLGFVGQGSVLFDMYGSGEQPMEWLKGGDGFVVDARGARQAIAQGRPLNGRDLMGDAEGMPGGYDKLATYDRHQAGKIVGMDLDQLRIWINKADDGKLHSGELYTPEQLGISEIDYQPRIVYDRAHEPLEEASFVQRGRRYLSQEVWFALGDAMPKGSG